MAVIKIDIVGSNRPCVMSLDLDAELPNEKTILNHVTAGQFYEPDIAKVFLRVLQDGDVMIDVGGNAGFFTILGAALTGPTGKVLTFEPDQRNVARLSNNVAINGFGHVTIVERPAMDEAKPVTFFINSDNSGGSALWDVGLFPGSELSRATPQPVTLEGTTLDIEVTERGLSDVKLIKVDAEGAEHLVVLGAATLLAGARVPFVIAELNEFALPQMGSSQMALRRYMEGLGYQTFMLFFDGNLPRLIPPETLIQTRFFCNILFSTAAAVGRYWPQYMHDPGPL